jgi:hypothetical protein
MATALLALATSGCVDPLDDSLKPQPEEPTLTFWIRVPGSMVTTKAETGDVASISPESMIYDVQVWAFAHGAADTDLPLNYVDKNISDNLPFENTTQKNWDDSYKIQMPMPKEFVLGTDPRVDFYILANWQSIFTTKPSQMTLADVRDMVFGASTVSNAPFGTATPTTAVPAKGLPISTIYMGDDGNGVSLQFLQDAYNGTGAPLTNELFKSQLGVIELERAVAKIRFAFARTKGVTGVQITKVEIDGNLIPNSIYAFPNSRTNFYPDATPAFGDVTTLAGTGTNPLFVADNTATNDIKEVALPDALAGESEVVAATTGKIYTGKKPSEMTAQEYDTFLADSTTTQLIYFRESDKPITGKIYYRKSASDTEDTIVEFSMQPNEDNPLDFPDKTNFHRNHYWTVYAYFLGNGLYIKPVVLPWEDGTSYTYEQRGSAVVAISNHEHTLFSYGWTTANENPWWQAHQNDNPAAKTEWYFRRQDVGNTNWDYDWLHSQMVSAPGLNLGGAPIYANRIELRTNGFITPLRLKLSNTEDFYLVTYNAANAEYVSWIAGGDNVPSGWTEADGALIPSIVSAGGTTYFYVVPKEGETHEGKTTEAYLVTDPSAGTGSQKLPFNAGLFPGSNENTEINFYSVSVATFRTYYVASTRPDNIRVYGKDSDGKINPISID